MVIRWSSNTHPSMSVLSVTCTLMFGVFVGKIWACSKLRTENQRITLWWLCAWCPFPIRFVWYLSTTCPVLVRFISIHIRWWSVCIPRWQVTDNYRIRNWNQCIWNKVHSLRASIHHSSNGQPIHAIISPTDTFAIRYSSVHSILHCVTTPLQYDNLTNYE